MVMALEENMYLAIQTGNIEPLADWLETEQATGKLFRHCVQTREERVQLVLLTRRLPKNDANEYWWVRYIVWQILVGSKILGRRFNIPESIYRT